MTDAEGPVVVGIDGSEDGTRALRWASAYAGATGAAVRAVAVLGHDLAGSDAADEVETTLVQEAQSVLAEAGTTTYEVETRVGKAAEELIRLSPGASVVVLGSRGHGAIEGLMVGSVSQHVARHADSPVVVVREPAAESATRVVVGTDGSEESAAALEWAFAYAAATGVALTVIYGFRTSASSPAVLSGYIPTSVGDEIAAAEEMLASIVAPWESRYPRVVVTREAIPVPAAVAIGDASETAALVVVGSRGRGAFEGMLLGSVSQSLLHRARCSVAVVR